MILSEASLFKKVDDRLNSLLQNEGFQLEFQGIQVYYIKKFAEIINDNDRKIFNSWLRKSMSEQFQNGYLMIEQYYNDESAYIDESLYTLPEGMFTQNVPLILREILQPIMDQGVLFDEIIDTDTTHELIIWAMEKYEDIRPLIKQTSFDLTCLGARQALRDKREEFGFETKVIEGEEKKLGNIGDFQFINPQMFLKINYTSPDVEYWDINYWSSNLNGIEKIGEVLVLAQPEYIETQTKISYHLTLLNFFSQYEIDEIANTHIQKLTDYAELDEIQYYLTLATDFLA